MTKQAWREQLTWGELGWLCGPQVSGAGQLTVLEATLLSGRGHSFHKHPDQEEVLYVVEGTVEQWLEQEKRELKAGDSAFIPAGMVHASSHAGSGPAKFVAILGPCVGDTGYVSVEVDGETPWSTLRAAGG